MIGTWVPGLNARQRRLLGSPALMNVSCPGGGAVGSFANRACSRSSTSVPCDNPATKIGPSVLRIAASRLFVPALTELPTVGEFSL